MKTKNYELRKRLNNIITFISNIHCLDNIKNQH